MGHCDTKSLGEMANFKASVLQDGRRTKVSSEFIQVKQLQCVNLSSGRGSNKSLPPAVVSHCRWVTCQSSEISCGMWVRVMWFTSPKRSFNYGGLAIRHEKDSMQSTQLISTAVVWSAQLEIWFPITSDSKWELGTEERVSIGIERACLVSCWFWFDIWPQI